MKNTRLQSGLMKFISPRHSVDRKNKIPSVARQSHRLSHCGLLGKTKVVPPMGTMSEDSLRHLRQRL